MATADDGTGRRQALEKALDDFATAWARGDTDRLRALLSPSYTHNDAFGARHDHRSWLAYAEGRRGRKTEIAFRDVETRIFGDVAIVTGYNLIGGAGATSADDRDDLKIVFTQVWMWRDGRWLRESFQATPVRASGAS
jgi:ketosteroid isomerase-like protein